MNYTSVEQSKKLLELGLKAESADMLYTWDTDNKTYYSLPIVDDKEHDFPSGLSCWSLAALLSVLPEGVRLLKSANISSVGDVKYHCDFHRGTIDEWYDNPVDACVAMIEKLHELEML